jgi:proteic killer suppression protein
MWINERFVAIKTFKHKGLKKLFDTGSKAGINPGHANRIKLILDLLNGAMDAKDMNFPGSKFHPLTGNFKGFYSVWVNGNWRIVFRFEDGEAKDVDLIDYH